MTRVRIILFLILLIMPITVLANEPSSEPILKIETGMHIAVITRIGIDANERYLVTASNDKTVRLWELKTGRLIKTLRPPIGEGDEGKIHAVAISPDARHIAAGGWTGYEWDKSFSIYIFDRDTGSLIQRITNLPIGIHHLTYSKDGRYLAAGLGRNNGIRIYDAKDGFRLVNEDKDYGDSVLGMDFSHDGRLVVSSIDGYIRLYDKNFELVKKAKAPGGDRPHQVSFSTDGSKVALGYADTPRVDIISGYDLSLLYTADTTFCSGCSFYGVSFSSDRLFAGGRCLKWRDEKMFIRIWNKEGKGAYTDIPAI